MQTSVELKVRPVRSRRASTDRNLIQQVLTQLHALLCRLLEEGRTGIIDLRALPRMNKATYQYLRDSLQAGEVSAVIDAELRVEITETRFPGVWWTTHRKEQGDIVTELLEVTTIPALLVAHPVEMRAGLERLEEVLKGSAPG